MLKLVLLLVILSIFSTECTPRNYYHPEICKTKGSVDCSFQVGDQEKGACTVYNTTQCADFDFSGWMRQSSKHPAAQSDSIYTVDMIPYAFTTPRYQRQIYPAVNIVFTTSNKDVDGYILQIENSEIAMNICRIFDFRNSSTKNNTHFVYDCFVSLRRKGVHEFEMKVRALPHNEEMMYTISLPEAQSTETRNSSQWEPLVMVFNGGLKDNIVEVKFSQAPQHLNISSYQVSVLPTKSGDVPVQTITVEATGDALLNTRFLNVDRGFYSICIRPFSSTSSRHCDTARYTVFYVENKLPDKIIIIYIVAVCFAGIVVVIAVLLWLWWLFKPGSITIKPVVLLVYSYDCKEHDVAVLRYAKFLENQGGIKVLTIYGEQRSDPDLWLFSPYRNCDIVMVILSEGVFHKCENSNNPAMDEGYPCGDRLIPALSFLRTKILDNEKDFIQVYFEYSGTCHAPSFMQSGKWGKTFVIPRKMNRLLCHVYNQNPKIACLGVYPRMPGHDVISSPEGSMLIDSVEEMKQVLLKNDGVLQTLNDFTTKPEINRRHILPTVEKDRLRSTESESRRPENWSSNEGKKCNSIQNVPSKKLCSSYYNEGHMSDEENCVHSHLLTESSNNPCSVAECKPNLYKASEDIGKNGAPDMLHNTEISADQHLEDLKVILLKPGPSFPYLNSLNLSK